MLILKQEINQEVESFVELASSCQDFSQFKKYLSMLFAARIASEFRATSYGIDDLIQYFKVYKKKAKIRNTLVNRSGSLKITKNFSDPYEPVRHVLLGINRVESFLLYDWSVATGMGLNKCIDIIYEKNFWDGYGCDEFYVVYKPAKIISIHDLGRY